MKHFERYFRNGGPVKRVLSLLLALAMCLPMLSLGALANLSPVPEEALPTIHLDGNVVIDSAGQPTGIFELGIRVKLSEQATTSTDYMQNVIAYLSWNPEILRPMTWIDMEENGVMVPVAADVAAGTAASPFPSPIPAKSNDLVNTMEVFAGMHTAGAVSRGRMEMMLSYKRGSAIDDQSSGNENGVLLGVVRFQFITKDEDQNIIPLPTTNFPYVVTAENENTLTGERFPLAVTDATAGTFFVAFDKTYDPVAPNNVSEEQHLWFETVGGAVGYWTPELFGIESSAIDATEIAGRIPGTTNSEGLLTPGTNLLAKLRMGESFAQSGGVDINNLSTILFYGLNDELLGALTVPKGVDVRKQVNDYVNENFVHEDLRNPTADQLISLDRKDTYRGSYPHIEPGKGDTTKDGDPFYSLTGYLDYAFLRRVGHVETDENGTYWVQDAAYDAEYPWIHGWAVCEGAVEDTWTTIGVGELELEGGASRLARTVVTRNVNWNSSTVQYDGYNAADGARFPIENMDFEIADFKTGLKDSIYSVKQTMEPGSYLDTSDYYRVLPETLKYFRYGTTASTMNGSSYGVSFAYERINNTGYGVFRTRMPVFRASYSPDVEGIKQSSFYVEVSVDNTEIIDVEMTPASGVYALEYNLVDAYNLASYTVGATRSREGDELNVLTNFNYENYIHKSRLGTSGFVYSGTLNLILDIAYRINKENPDEGADSELITNLTANTLLDLNLKYTASNYASNDTEVEIIRNNLKLLFKQAYENGVNVEDGVDATGTPINPRKLTGEDAVRALDWHQLQYAILKRGVSSAIDGDGAILSPSAIRAQYKMETSGAGFSWCRDPHDHDCGCAMLDVITINTWSNFIDALYAYAEDPRAITDTNLSLSVLNGNDANSFNLWLRKENGVNYTNLNEFTAQINALVTALNSSVAIKNAIKATPEGWQYVQYFLINGYFHDTPTMQNEAKTYYWWYNGGKPVTDVETLLKAVKQAIGGNMAPINSITNIDMINNVPFYLRTNEAGTGMFASVTDLINKLSILANNTSDAQAATATWDQLQYAIVKGLSTLPDEATAAAYSNENFWWKGGGQKVTNWATLKQAAIVAYNTGAEAALRTTDMSWFTTDAITTDVPYLRADINGTAFADKNDFVTKMIAAVGAIGADNFADASWDRIQYAIIHGTDGTSSEYTDESNDYYWWKNYGKKITDIATLRTALKAAKEDRFALLNSIAAVSDIPLNLRSNFKGEPFGSAVAFVNQMKALAKGSLGSGMTLDNITAAQVQYYLVHTDFGTALNMNNEANSYYWWFSGYVHPTLNFENDDAETSVVTTLINAAWRAEVNGYDFSDIIEQDAWTNLTLEQLTSVYRFTTSDSGKEYYLVDGSHTSDCLPKFSSVATFTQRIKKLIANAGDDYSTLTWEQIQYALLDENDGAYISSADLASLAPDYWWKTKDAKNDVRLSGMDILLDYLTQYYDGDITSSALQALLTNDFLTGSGYDQLGLKTKTGGALTGTNLTNLKNRIVYAVNSTKQGTQLATNSQYYNSQTQKIQFTWYQVNVWSLGAGAQIPLTNGNRVLVSPLDAFTWYKSNCTYDVPEYVTPKPDETWIEPWSLNLIEPLAIPEEVEPEYVVTETVTYSEDGLTKTVTIVKIDPNTMDTWIELIVETGEIRTKTIVMIAGDTGETQTVSTIVEVIETEAVPEIPVEELPPVETEMPEEVPSEEVENENSSEESPEETGEGKPPVEEPDESEEAEQEKPSIEEVPDESRELDGQESEPIQEPEIVPFVRASNTKEKSNNIAENPASSVTSAAIDTPVVSMLSQSPQLPLFYWRLRGSPGRNLYLHPSGILDMISVTRLQHSTARIGGQKR